MILDLLGESAKYEKLHPGFAPAFAHLRSVNVSTLQLGRHAVDGERLQVIFERASGRGLRGSKLEVHRRYLDLQIRLAEPTGSMADEVIGWRPLSACEQPNEAFNTDRDIQFYNDDPLTWLRLTPGTFAIFYPTDAHAPLAGEGQVLKVIYKIAADWDE